MRASTEAAASSDHSFAIEPAGKWEWILLAAGVVLRFLLQVPLHRYPGDADCVLTALQSAQVLDGDPAVFVPSGYRLGALNAYVTALFDVLFGVGRPALAAGAITVGSLQMLVWWLATRELAGSRLARVALPFIVVPSPAVLEWGLHLPNANPEIFLASTLVLWLGARIRRRGGGAVAYCLFGLACGVAFWASILTLGISLPVAIWVGRGARREMSIARLAASAIGALVGALPWLAFNFRYGWQSLTKSAATDAVSNWAGFRRAASNLWRDRAAQLWTGADGFGESALQSPRAIFWAAAVILVAFVVFRSVARAFAGRAAAETERRFLALAAGSIALLVAMNLASRLSLTPGPSVRYLLPAALWIPPLFGFAWASTGARARRAIAAASAAALLFHLSAPVWPWTQTRHRQRVELERNRLLASTLVAEGVDAVYGTYWIVLPLVLDSDLVLIGVPSDPNTDFLRARARSLPEPAQWAIADRFQMARAVAKRSKGHLIDARPYGAVLLEEGAGPAGRANGPAFKAWWSWLAQARQGLRPGTTDPALR